MKKMMIGTVLGCGALLVQTLAGCGESIGEPVDPPGAVFQKYDPIGGYAALYVTWSTGQAKIRQSGKSHAATLSATDMAALKSLFTNDKVPAYRADSELDYTPETSGRAGLACPPSKESTFDPETGLNLCMPPLGKITRLEYVISATDDRGRELLFALFDGQNAPATASMIQTLEEVLTRYAAAR